ncbi:aldehyde dehydrogenase family protein [Aliiglaciecola sp. LCG003]|uniref:aldehyde dehydrogenase family protein n=1 Tax=Aliiglaciecola sp. LCG003 TaxID=3053655 RepID=UPI0025730817|nr:aldehyde dehydrogenase family protein [Aliiglaciecola sp. LCG003]WJG09072.1 aldehyde dehydrogenase family protein [Aliiglaciecola sp. LCG003]
MSDLSPTVEQPSELSQIATIVAGLRDTFSSGYPREYSWRVEQLNQLKRMTLEQQDKILAALHADLGKCKSESWLSEIGFIVGDIEHTLKKLKKWMKPRKVSTPIAAQPGCSYQLPEPLGTVLIIGAWNYPFQLVFAPLIAAISAGNCAVLKPSELASQTSKLIAEIVPQYLDSNAIAVVEGAVDETTELLKQPFEHIFYTGGETVGKIVMRAAAEHLTPVTLELGGKSPCIVESSADIEVTAARIVWSKWMNAGQTCVAPDYVLVEKSLSSQLIAAIQKKLQAFYGQDIKSSKDYGRIVNQRHFARLSHYLEGQNIVFGGEQDLDKKYFAPTIVLDPALDSELMQQEIFGPILPIITLNNINESIPFVNQRAKPLALYVFTANSQFEQKVLNQTSAGSTCVNDGFMFMLNPELPFGGVGHSGMGNYHGKFGFDTFSHLKTVMKRSFKFDVSLRYPPFSALKLSILKRLL